MGESAGAACALETRLAIHIIASPRLNWDIGRANILLPHTCTHTHTHHLTTTFQAEEHRTSICSTLSHVMCSIMVGRDSLPPSREWDHTYGILYVVKAHRYRLHGAARRAMKTDSRRFVLGGNFDIMVVFVAGYTRARCEWTVICFNMVFDVWTSGVAYGIYRFSYVYIYTVRHKCGVK